MSLRLESRRVAATSHRAVLCPLHEYMYTLKFTSLAELIYSDSVTNSNSSTNSF